ncbi:MAG: DNA mismatch repair protein MutT [Xanthomonadales bacterium]|nr:DNA mismatch repair protein MutT [Xanthomonadales bacterium]
MKTKTHYKGRYLSLVERDDWEFATRTNPVVAVLVAWLPDHRLVLVEQYRKPIERMTIELPAGLVGEQRDQADESVLAAAHRELVEETGYSAGKITEIMRCPTSAGMTDEIAVFLAAGELERTGPGGGDDSEDITVHTIEHARIDAWLRDQYRQGKAIDPKIYTALYWGVPGLAGAG